MPAPPSGLAPSAHEILEAHVTVDVSEITGRLLIEQAAAKSAAVASVCPASERVEEKDPGAETSPQLPWCEVLRYYVMG